MSFPVPWRCLLPRDFCGSAFFREGVVDERFVWQNPSDAHVAVEPVSKKPPELADEILVVAGAGPQKETLFMIPASRFKAAPHEGGMEQHYWKTWKPE